MKNITEAAIVNSEYFLEETSNNTLYNKNLPKK
jgi:hypothetical protein